MNIFNLFAKLGYQIVVVDENYAVNEFYGTKFSEIESESKKWLALSGSTTIYHGIRDYKQNFSIMNHYANDVQNTVGVPFSLENKNFAMFIRMDNASIVY